MPEKKRTIQDEAQDFEAAAKSLWNALLKEGEAVTRRVLRALRTK